MILQFYISRLTQEAIKRSKITLLFCRIQLIRGIEMSSVKELLEMQVELNRELEEARRIERPIAIAQAIEIIKTHQLMMSDLFPNECLANANSPALKGKPAKSAKSVLPAMYKNPVTGAEWSGRGRNPAWFKAFSKEEQEASRIDKP